MADIDDIIERVERRIGVAMDTIRIRLREILSRIDERGGLVPYDAQTASDIEATMRTIRAEMDRAGLGELVASLDDDIDELIESIKKEARGFGLPGQFTGPTTKVVEAMRSRVIEQISAQFGNGAATIENFLSGAMLGGVKRSDLILSIQDALDTTLARARTAASTSLQSAHSQVTVSHAKEYGIEWFAYVGPDDSVTREWCEHVIDHRGTPEMWEDGWDKWNRQSSAKGIEHPVMVFRGGWNCRHRFIPVFGDDLAKYEVLRK